MGVGQKPPCHKPPVRWPTVKISLSKALGLKPPSV